MENSDIPYELEVCEHPEREDSWLAYIQHLKARGAKDVDSWLMYERALLSHPKSYLIWRPYLQERTEAMMSVTRQWNDPKEYTHQIALTNGCYERCLQLRVSEDSTVWFDFATFLLAQRRIIRCLSVMDDALRILPFHQHHRIWQLLMRIVEHFQEECPHVGLHLWRRFCQLERTARNYNQLIEVAKKASAFSEAVDAFLILMNEFDSKNVTEASTLIEGMANLVNECPPQEQCEKYEKWVGEYLERLKYQGSMYCTLATYWVHLGDLAQAENIFEQGLTNVIGGNNFSLVYEAYGKLEETLIKALLQDPDDDSNKAFIDSSIQRFSSMIERRLLLLTDALLRQNANKPHLWLKKIHLSSSSEDKSSMYEEAIKSCTYLTSIYIDYASYLKANAQNWEKLLEERAVKDCSSDATFWIEWSKLHEGKEDLKLKLNVLETGSRRCKDLKLWTFYIDLLESQYFKGKREYIEDTLSVYHRMLDLGIIQKDQVVNYILFLEEVKKRDDNNNNKADSSFHDVFQILIKAINKCPWPEKGDLWKILLDKGINYWVPQHKYERIRELFEEATKDCPPACNEQLYLMWAKFEEQHGLIRNALHLYSQMALKAEGNIEKQLELVQLAVTKAKELSSLSAARPIFELALKKISWTDDSSLLSVALDFAGLETALKEIQRARAIFQYAAQTCRFWQPDTSPLWTHWTEFERTYGNETSMRELLRVKRQLQKKAQQDPFFVKEGAGTTTAAITQ